MAPGADSPADSKRRGGETIIVSDKTVLLNNAELPLIFGWLVEQESNRYWRVASDTFAIGSDPTNDLTVAGTDIKDVHCSIYFAEGRFEVNDHNTRSGTRVNGMSVKRQELADNDLLEIGSRRFRFKCFMGGGRG